MVMLENDNNEKKKEKERKKNIITISPIFSSGPP